MITFTGVLRVAGPRIGKALLSRPGMYVSGASAPAAVSFDEATGESIIEVDVTALVRGVWSLCMFPQDPTLCCPRRMQVWVEGCTPTVIPGHYDNTAVPTPIPTCVEGEDPCADCDPPAET